jgi:hypothetical protein
MHAIVQTGTQDVRLRAQVEQPQGKQTVDRSSKHHWRGFKAACMWVSGGGGRELTKQKKCVDPHAHTGPPCLHQRPAASSQCLHPPAQQQSAAHGIPSGTDWPGHQPASENHDTAMAESMRAKLEQGNKRKVQVPADTLCCCEPSCAPTKKWGRTDGTHPPPRKQQQGGGASTRCVCGRGEGRSRVD